ncbi:MAG: hypothetical protein SFU53_09660 [Terrimicrobiaceae bacterium]|nr:hypothetical protein [Terrimicrobiaceae bacterium]
MRLPVFLTATIAGTLFLHAQELTEGNGVIQPAPTKILDSQEVDLGDRKITYNRIEAPALKPQPLPEAAPEAPKEHIPTAEELAEARRWESLRYEYLGGTATVIDGVGTEFRIWTPEGDAVALSSIGFNFLNSFWDFERDGVYYSTFFFAYGYSPEEFAEAKLADPEWAAQFGPFPKEEAGMSRFSVVSVPKGKVGENAIRALGDLHAQFDENRKQLLTAYEESEKARIAQEEWLKANPPVPKDTVVNFFPIRSVHAPKSVSSEEQSRK